jgi:dipeptidase D
MVSKQMVYEKSGSYRKACVEIMNSLEQMDYKGVIKGFEEISKIPRGSGNVEKISNHLVEFAKKHNLKYKQDEAKNVIIIKEASAGRENEPGIILQGHMDMVCEKRRESTIDFLNDGIKLITDGDYLHADGTTLGADDGIAIAYIMAFFSDETLNHPRLEAVITTDEEVGMKGAAVLDTSLLKGKYLINIDSEEEEYLLSGCAGGFTGTSTLPVIKETAYGKKVKLSIRGLKGGHSGSDINKNRTNANKLMGRLLFDLREDHSFRLIDILGGFKDNVIPREADADLLITAVDEKELNEKFIRINDGISKIMAIYQKELSGSEPQLECSVQDVGNGSFQVLHPVSFEKMLFLLVNMPYGIQVMSSDIEGLVESSLNLGIFHIKDDKAIFVNSVRSSSKSYKYYMGDKLNYLVSLLGGDFSIDGDYPAWEYKKDSKLREHLQKIYHGLYGKEMKVAAIHAGLECGYMNEKIPGVDCVSIGPEMSGVHTIEEKVSISSVIRVYKFLEKVISERI